MIASSRFSHTYSSFANTTFGCEISKIRILIQQQDLYIAIRKLSVCQEKTKKVVQTPVHVALRNNCVAFKLSGVEIDRDWSNRNMSITSTLKNYVTVLSDRSVILRNAGWDAQTTAAGYFNFYVPLYGLLGLCKDYKRMVINACLELILIGARNDNNWQEIRQQSQRSNYSKYSGEYRTCYWAR